LHDDDQAEQVKERFARTAERIAARERANRDALREKVRQFVPLTGDERVLDSGTGTGALAFALAPLVREVVAVDIVPELLQLGRQEVADFPNVTFVEADANRLPYDLASFDLTGCHRTLHHVARPELAVAEMARVTKLGGLVLIVDQIAPADPLEAVELDRFEQARDPSHTRLLPDGDVHALLDANGLVLRASRHEVEFRDLDNYLDLAGCEGAARDTARSTAPAELAVDIGWYLAARPLPRHVSFRA